MMVFLGVQFLNINLPLLKLVVSFLTLQVGQAIHDQELIEANVLVHSGFGKYNVALKSRNRFGLRLGGKRGCAGQAYRINNTRTNSCNGMAIRRVCLRVCDRFNGRPLNLERIVLAGPTLELSHTVQWDWMCGCLP